MAGRVLRETAEWLIFSLVLFALVFENLLHRLERFISHRYPHLQTVLRNLYRELMIMGIVSFGFILYIFVEEPSDNILFTFEVAHIFIFLFAVFHAFVVTVTVLMSLQLSARWKRLERMDLVKYLDYKDSYRKLNDRLQKHQSPLWQKLGWWIPHPNRIFRYSKLHEIMAFHDLRYQFIYYRNLPHSFRFSKFLRKIKSATFIELVEINPVNWVIMLLIVLLDILRIKYGFFTPIFEPIFLMVHAVLNAAFASVLSAKIHSIYYKLTINPATYYDQVDRRAIEEEIAIAEEEARIRRISVGDSDSDTDEPMNTNAKQHSRRHRRDEQSSLTEQSSADTTPNHPNNESASHAPVYAHLAYIPPRKNTNNGKASLSQRHSLDMSKAISNSGRQPNDLNQIMKPAKYEPAKVEDRAVEEITAYLPDAVSRGSRGESASVRHKPSTSAGCSKVSVELAEHLPRDELDNRTALTIEGALQVIENTQLAQYEKRLDDLSPSRRKLRMEAVRSLHEKRRPSAGIVKIAQELQQAQQSTPTQKYHWLVVKLFPRLGRVPSEAERLFWFGSHRFFIFCVEFVLFFTNINITTTIAKLASLRKSAIVAKGQSKAVRLLFINTVMREVIVPPENRRLLLITLGVSIVSFGIVLHRIATIMPRYIYVLNNANLLSENMTLETIQRVNLKNAMQKETMEQPVTSSSQPESEVEEENYKQIRRNVSSFLHSNNEEIIQPSLNSTREDGHIVFHTNNTSNA